MKYLMHLILFVSFTIDPKSISFFTRLSDQPKFVSSTIDKNVWTSEVRKYCFFAKELSYFLQYEVSPAPIPAFKVKSSLSDIYITVDIYSEEPLRLQNLINVWEKLSSIKQTEEICFSGAYLPSSKPHDAAYIMIDQIKSKNIALSIVDYSIDLKSIVR